MSREREALIAEYLRMHPLPGVAGTPTVSLEFSNGDMHRYRVTAGAARRILNVYAPAAIEAFRRENSGLRLGGMLGLAPALVLADEVGAALGGPFIISEDPGGSALGARQLRDEDVQDWLLLLLTLHHLPADSTVPPSSMSPDANTWWQRTQVAWNACRADYSDARYRPLVEALTRLHAIVTARIEVHRALWQDITRRPCHGNPVPAHAVRAGERLMLIEWDGFGLGDPALEVGRVAALAVLSGELSTDQYVRFVTEYLVGMRDQRDATLEERLRVFASILPLGFCFAVLRMLAQDVSAGVNAERDAHLAQVASALTWIQDTLGVQVGEADTLLAPLRTA